MTENVKSNPLERIEAVFCAGPLYIERSYLEKLVGRFLAELEVMASGGDVLGEIKERRKGSEPKLIYFGEGGELRTAKFTGEEIKARSGQFAHLKLSGAMVAESFLSTRGVDELVADMRAADEAPNIDGILLEMNTGGGELLAGQMLRNAVKDAKKPVLVYAHYLASAGVWGTIFADHIMAAGKGSEIGSIGVYTAFNRTWVERYKNEVVDVYSRKSPNKNKDFRSLLNGDVSVLQDAVTEADEIFMADVRRNRPLAGDIDDTLAGGMFFGTEAKKRGLIDSIGTFSDAVNELSRLSRNQKNSAMNKLSLKDLAKKFLGLEVTDEEAAAEALEAAEAPTEKVNVAEEAMAALAGRVDALQAQVEALVTKADSLLADLAEVQAKAVPTAEDVAKAAEDAAGRLVDALRLEVAEEMNTLRAGKSGKEVAGEEPVSLPGGKKGEEAPKIDLLADVKGRKVTVVRSLN